MKEFTKKCLCWCWSVRREAAKYIIVGFSSFFIDIGLFAILNTILGIWYVLATAISQGVAIIYNFTMNRNWSFRSAGSKRKQFIRYMILQAWNYTFAIIALVVFVDVFGINPLLGKVFAIAIIVSWNFLLYKFFVYK